MPLYEYACAACGHRFEIRQGIREASLTTCPECGGAIRRMVFPAGIVFKGSGFYNTDSPNTPQANVPAGSRTADTIASAGEPAGAKSNGDGSASPTTAPAAPAATPAPSSPAASAAK